MLSDAYFDELEKIAVTLPRIDQLTPELAEQTVGRMRRMIQRETGRIAKDKEDLARMYQHSRSWMPGLFDADYRQARQSMRQNMDKRLNRVKRIESSLANYNRMAGDILGRANPQSAEYQAAQRFRELYQRGGSVNYGPSVPTAEQARGGSRLWASSWNPLYSGGRAQDAAINPHKPKLGLMDSPFRRYAAYGTGTLGVGGLGYLALNNAQQGRTPQGY